MSVLAVMESAAPGSEERWNPVALEAVAAAGQVAKAFGSDIDTAVMGYQVAESAYEAARLSVRTVHVLDHPLLQLYSADGYAAALEQLIRRLRPTHVFFPHTYRTRDFAPKLAARFGTALVSDVVAIEADQPPIRYVRPLFLGKLRATLHTHSSVTFVSVQAGAFEAARVSNSANATIEEVHLELSPEQIRSKTLAPTPPAVTTVDLGSAKSIVSVGRGAKNSEELSLVQSLARELGAELAASRPMCDSGMVPMERLVGSSGQTVCPDLYLAVGISGAIQHVLGMSGAKAVVAINRDADAPIFDIARYGIVGEIAVVIPFLIDELRKLKS